jgi:hypothetical protein
MSLEGRIAVPNTDKFLIKRLQLLIDSLIELFNQSAISIQQSQSHFPADFQQQRMNRKRPATLDPGSAGR